MKKSKLKKLRLLSNNLSSLLSQPNEYHGYLQRIQKEKVIDKVTGKEIEISIRKEVVLSKLSPRRIYKDGKRLLKDPKTSVLSDAINLKEAMKEEGLL